MATLVRHDAIMVSDAVDIWQRSTRLFTPGECDVDMIRALRMASQHNISAYDAQYVSLAMALGVPYVTEDQQLLKSFPDIALPMQEFCRI
jgi:predicted nucleic acid-binding protein